MKKNVIIFILAIFILPIVLMGCSPKAAASPTTNPDLIYTAAAQTADTRLTQIFQSTPSATPVTPTPTFDATQTAVSKTASVVLTQVAGVTVTPQVTASSTPVPPVPPGPAGDRAVFVADVTIPDGTIIAPGAAFVKTWRLQNAGTTTWTTSYFLAYVSGEQMGTITSVPLAQSVAPGSQIDISVDMVAPTNTGTYTSYWKMKNASGQFFNDSVYVMIGVGSGGATQPVKTSTPGATPTSTGVPANPISSLTMSVDADTFSGPCPYTFTFAATFTLNPGATLTYTLEAGSDTPGFQFDLPGSRTSIFGPGTYSLTFPMEFTDSGTGWVRLHITAPVDMTSNQATFNLTCTP